MGLLHVKFAVGHLGRISGILLRIKREWYSYSSELSHFGKRRRHGGISEILLGIKCEWYYVCMISETRIKLHLRVNCVIIEIKI
jgi:hypothetical protein